MDPDSIHALAAKAMAHHYAPGECIFRQGDVGDSLYVIKTGTVTLSLEDSETGESRPLATLAEGDFFGEMSLLTGECRSASAYAEANCELLVIDRRHMAPLLEEHPELMRRISQTIAARRQDTATVIASLAETREASVPQAVATHEVVATTNEIFNRIRSFFTLS
jgi:CRP-like cAMP-binding protein